MKRKTAFYVAFEKAEKQEDGTMIVSGVASSEAVDSDGEIITASAMKAALPDYMKFGAIREMHQPIAAGTAIKCEVDAEGVTHLEAKIVDPTSVLKVEEGVLKGFSIGGKVTGKDPLNKSIITGIRLTEISLVDRPANPEAIFSLGKVEDSEETPTFGTLRKGMWGVSRFADLLQSLAYVATDAQFESEYEGDASPVPGRLGAWVEEGLEILQAMTAEEAAELAACLPKAPAAVLAMAEKAEGSDDLAKAGAKYSKATKDAIKALRSKAAEIAECLKVFDDIKDEDDKEDDEEESAKASASEDLQKAEGLQDELQKAQAKADDLEKRVKELEAMPEAPKGVVKVLEKAQDVGTPDELAAAEAEFKKLQAMPEGPEKAAELIKFIHKTGGK